MLSLRRRICRSTSEGLVPDGQLRADSRADGVLSLHRSSRTVDHARQETAQLPEIPLRVQHVPRCCQLPHLLRSQYKTLLSNEAKSRLSSPGCRYNVFVVILVACGNNRSRLQLLVPTSRVHR